MMRSPLEFVFRKNQIEDAELGMKKCWFKDNMMSETCRWKTRKKSFTENESFVQLKCILLRDSYDNKDTFFLANF